MRFSILPFVLLGFACLIIGGSNGTEISVSPSASPAADSAAAFEVSNSYTELAEGFVSEAAKSGETK